MPIVKQKYYFWHYPAMRGCSAVAVFAKSDEDFSRNSSFSAETENLGNVAIIHCFGRLCFQGEAMVLAEIAQESMRAGHELVLDFSALHLLDSAGIGQLVLISMQAQAHGRDVCIACASDRVRYLLDLTNVASLFEFFGSVSGALEECSSNAA
jgi:anti-anti-sigma factor